MGSFYGIWNLDFFRFYDLGLCLKTDTLATLSLDLAIAIYPLILIAFTYFLIQVYDANFIIVVNFGSLLKHFSQFYTTTGTSRHLLWILLLPFCYYQCLFFSFTHSLLASIFLNYLIDGSLS